MFEALSRFVDLGLTAEEAAASPPLYDDRGQLQLQDGVADRSSPSRTAVRLHRPEALAAVDLDHLKEAVAQARSAMAAAHSDSEDSDDPRLVARGEGMGHRGHVSGEPPTHVILRAASLWGLSRKMAEEASVASSGRRGFGHFLDDDTRMHITATFMLLPGDMEPFNGESWKDIVPSSTRRRYARPKVAMKARGRTVEAHWPDGPAETFSPLEPPMLAVKVAAVVGTEVVAVTGPIDMRGHRRRFWEEYPLFEVHHDPELDPDPVGHCRLAFDLWPPNAELRGFASAADPGDPTEIEGLQLTCQFCDGAGRSLCPVCNGNGALVCQSCDGAPNLPCLTCHGDGVVQEGLESICNQGRVRTVPRTRRCTDCWGITRSCQECFGIQALRCGNCSGAGYLPCTRCVPETLNFV